jgi:PUA domain protein
MRPGVSRIEGQFAKDELIVILDEKYRKTIALGIAEVDSETMQSMTKGRVINNIHYVGDPVWNAFSTAKS